MNVCATLQTEDLRARSTGIPACVPILSHLLSQVDSQQVPFAVIQPLQTMARIVPLLLLAALAAQGQVERLPRGGYGEVFPNRP